MWQALVGQMNEHTLSLSLPYNNSKPSLKKLTVKGNRELQCKKLKRQRKLAVCYRCLQFLVTSFGVDLIFV